MMNNRMPKKLLMLIGLALANLFVVACHKDAPLPDQPADTTDVPDVPELPANEGYLAMNGDTLQIYAVCKTASTAASLDISFSNRPELLFTILDSDYEPNSGSHPVQFGINPERSTTYSGDTYDGTIEVKEAGGRYEIIFSGSTSTSRVNLYYQGTLDDANAPAGQATLTIGQNTAEFNLARVFSYDQTYSYLVYADDYSSAIKIVSEQPLLAGEYQIDNNALGPNTVKVQVIYFKGEYVNAKPTSGTLTVGREKSHFDMSLQAHTAQGEMAFSYQGSFNRQCVVDF